MTAAVDTLTPTPAQTPRRRRITPMRTVQFVLLLLFACGALAWESITRFGSLWATSETPGTMLALRDGTGRWLGSYRLGEELVLPAGTYRVAPDPPVCAAKLRRGSPARRAASSTLITD